MLCKKCHTEMTVMQEDNVSGLICPKCGWNIITTKIDDIMLDTQLYQLFVLKNEHINRNQIRILSKISGMRSVFLWRKRLRGWRGKNRMEDVIRKYFQCWLDKDINDVKEIFSDDIIYSECYGPVYKGIGQIIRWFDDWNRKGTVLQWDIKRVIASGNTAVVEWYFECDYEGNVDGFDGVTIAEFDADNYALPSTETPSNHKSSYPHQTRQ
jgi:hypothetical protein